jgi:Holliday junction DNA helicase RuvA
MVVREDSMTLYGFASTDERELFDLLTGVTGVGPKVGLAFLSALQPEALRRAVIAGDADTLTVVPGVGKKVAQRVVLDLRDKLGGAGADVISIGPLADVREALLALGLTSTEAAQVMAGIDPEGKAPDDLLREALQKVGR